MMFEEHLRALCESDEYSNTTVSLARVWLARFELFCAGKSPEKLTPKDLEQWLKELTWTPGPSGKLYAQNTLIQAVGAVRRFYRWLLAEGELKKDPTVGLVPSSGVKTVRKQSARFELGPGEIRKLLMTPDLDTPLGIRNRALLGFLLETKPSDGACSRLNLTDLQFDTGAVLIRGKKRRVCSLTDGLLCDLDRYLRESRPLLIKGEREALFLNQKGGRLSKGSVRKIYLDCRKLAGV